METPPRENQRVTRGNRQVPPCDSWRCTDPVSLGAPILSNFVTRRPLERTSDRRFFLTLGLSRRTYNHITVEADFVTAMVSAKLGFRPLSTFSWKHDLGELRQGVLHET